MKTRRSERRLAAILAADVAGYTRALFADEAGALGAVRALRAEVIEPALAERSGRLFKTTGDGFLAEFASAVDAMDCAMAIQTALAESPRGLALRIGVSVGDVVIEDGDVFGEAVAIAARLEDIAEPGGVALTGAAREHLGGRIETPLRDDGPTALESVDRRVHVWRWRPDTAQEAPAPRLPDKPSIVVLPFDDLSADPAQGWFADGVVEALTAALSRIHAFFVIARNSAFAYKGHAVNVREIGRELGVAYVLEGSVQRAGDRVRITAQLVETTAGAHLWAERYDGATGDIFDLQDSIAERVAGALQPSIRRAEIDRAQRKRPSEMGAYDYAMRAMPYVWALERESATRALDLLDAARARDPDYPLALALAAWCHAQRAVYNWAADFRAERAEALALATRAASLSPDDPLVLAVLGAAHTVSGSFDAARTLIDRALAIDPNAAWTHSRRGWLGVYASDPDAAEPSFRRALRLSPLDPMNFNNFVGLAHAAELRGDMAGAVELLQRALRERPGAAWIHRSLAYALHRTGRIDEARASSAALLAAYPHVTTRLVREAMVLPERVIADMCASLAALGVPEG